jgi:RNA polymerase sigma-54 factor
MLKQRLQQKQQQKLSPLQIQTIKLLELPALELEQKMRKELEENPVLEEIMESDDPENDSPKNVSLSEYPADDPTPSYKLYVNNQGKDPKPQYNTFSVKESFQENLIVQLGYRKMDDRSRAMAEFVIGSLDDDGYLRPGGSVYAHLDPDHQLLHFYGAEPVAGYHGVYR